MENKMTLQERISHELKEAMKARDQEKLDTLRMLKSALGYAIIEKYGQNGTPTDEDVMAVVRKEVKKRNDSIESFEKAGRADVAEKETRERTLLETFLPAALSEAEMRELVAQAIRETGATSKKEMGVVMKRAGELAAGRADGKVLSSAVMRALGG
ncbi:MAG: GatB/YqeY domain-containing protein [Candidatus Methylacidiphilales bacterium]